MAALGAWLGLKNGVAALLCVAVAGIVLGLAFAISRGRLLEVVRKVALAMRQAALSVLLMRRWSALAEVPGQVRDSGPTQRMPYGLAICSGILAAALGTWLWRR